MTLTREWLLANGIAPETLDVALGQSEKLHAFEVPADLGTDYPCLIEAVHHGASWRATWRDWRPASKNEKHRGVGAWCRARRRDNDAVCLWANCETAPPPATGKRRITITVTRRSQRGRRPDPQNLEESCYDSLVLWNLVRDDSADWLERVPTTVAVDSDIACKVQTMITLEDV